MRKNFSSYRNTSLASLGLALVLSGPALAQGGAVKVIVDNAPIAFSGQQPVTRSGAVLVPLRGVFEKMGAQVAYDASGKTIKAKNDKSDITLTVGSRQATVNGKSMTLDTPTTVTNGAVLVPLRFVSENLGAGVDYSGPSHTVSIDTSKAAAPSTNHTVQMASAPTSSSEPTTASPASSTSQAATPPASSGAPVSSPINSQTPPATGAATPVQPTPPAVVVNTNPAPAATPTPLPPGPQNAATVPPGATPIQPAVPANQPVAVHQGPPVRTVVVTTPAADTGPGFAQYLPYIIGAIVLLAVLGWYLNRRGKTGQVIAAEDKNRRP